MQRYSIKWPTGKAWLVLAFFCVQIVRCPFFQLAELWPDGWMDNSGIKLAVHRAKERKKKQSKASNVRNTVALISITCSTQDTSAIFFFWQHIVEL